MLLYLQTRNMYLTLFKKGGFLNGNEPISLERKIVTFGFPSLKNIENIE